jgi:hypothetical protein
MIVPFGKSMVKSRRFVGIKYLHLCLFMIFWLSALVALGVIYHEMKVLEYASDKRKVLDALVPALALDCESEFYDCSRGKPPKNTASRTLNPDLKSFVTQNTGSSTAT